MRIKLYIQRFAGDGKVVIDIVANTKSVEKDIDKLKAKLNEIEKQDTHTIEWKGVKIDGAITSLTDEQIEEENKLIEQIEQLEQAEEERKFVEEMQTEELQKQNQVLEEQTTKYNEFVDNVMTLSDGTKIVKKDFSDTAEIIKRMDMNGLQNSVKKLGNEMSGIAKKAVRWGLAIVGVRRAITLVTRAFSTLQDYSEELRNTVSSIRLVMAVAFENIINKIISMVITLLNYVNYLSKAWFGVDLFARASELSSKKMADNLASGAGSAKEIRKQLAGFDEMNVLGDNVGSAGGGGIGKTNLPEFNMEDRPIPEWLKWVKDNGQLVAGILGAIGAAILAIKIAPLLNSILTGVSTVQSFTAGLALMSAGLVLVGMNVFDLVKNWDEMDTKTKVLEISLAALGAAMIAFGYAVAAGFSAATLGIGAVIAVVITLTTVMAGLIAKDVEEQKALRDATYYQKQYNQAKKDAEKAVNEYVRAEDDAIEAQRKLDEVQKKTGISGKALYDQVMNGTLKYADMTEKQKEVFKAFMDNKTAQDNLTAATKKMNKEVLNSQLQAALAEKDYKKYGETLKKGMQDGIINSDKMSKQLVNDMKGMDEQARITFIEALPKSIKNAFDWDKYGPKLKTFETNWNDYIKRLKKDIEVKYTYKLMLPSGTQKVYKNGGVVPLPRLASGAILNQPGRGVMIGGGSAIAGEAGAEGVIPLTNSQQMALLGKAIGRYITINANITNTMNGKVISRELQKIQNEDDFVGNR